MKCPKCGFNSFEFHDTCRKCGKDLAAFKASFNIRALVHPPAKEEQQTGAAPDDAEVPGNLPFAAPPPTSAADPLPAMAAGAADFSPDDFAFDSTPLEPPPAATMPPEPPLRVAPPAEPPPANVVIATAEPAPFDLPATEAISPDAVTAAKPSRQKVASAVEHPAPKQAPPAAPPPGATALQEGMKGEFTLDDFIHFSELNSTGKSGGSTSSFGKGGFELEDLFPPDEPKPAEENPSPQALPQHEEEKGEKVKGLDWLE
ncbi:hypothetical protein LPW11_06650 [Geomonas sp. RF6]|uniref:hypothetical protein n=1 Tax=Geomonas sp. RF6 TaxID=2897342 RepID=UPI001E526EC1|nr:hypothetical protein [Geomonas sp. RF6]UFS71867.1 hypothetical protein LPW11_06650 [Geomonas sp. RF6]